MDRLAPASEEVEREPKFYRRVPVTRRGHKEDAIVLAAPVCARAVIPGIAQNVRLRCLAAPMFNAGDGFQLDLILRYSGGEEKLYSRYFDPGRNALDRNWIDLEIPLHPREGEVGLDFRVSAGPQGDLVADSVALSNLRLVERRN
jgi:hypothetical protein